jgi:hypothetical protein
MGALLFYLGVNCPTEISLHIMENGSDGSVKVVDGTTVLLYFLRSFDSAH